MGAATGLQPTTPPPSLQPQQPPSVAPPQPTPDQKQQPPAKPAFSDPGVEKQYEQMQSKIGAAHDKMAAQTMPTLQTKPPPEAKQTGPLEVWGSAAMFLATIGSLMTRTPMTTALNSAAKVMEAFKKNDLETAQSEFERWKVESDNALKTAQFQMDSYRAALESAKDDETLAVSSFQAYAAAHNDQFMGQIAQQRNAIEAKRAVIDQQNAITQAREAQARIATMMQPLYLMNDANKAQQALAKAQQSKDPKQIEAATAQVKSAQDAINTYHTVTGKGTGGGASGMAIDPATAAEVASGMPRAQIAGGLGKSSGEYWTAARKAGIQYIQKQNPGMTEEQAGIQLAQNQIDYMAGRKVVMNLTNMRGFTEQSIKQLEYNVSQVNEALDKLPSSDISPVLNALARGEQKWTGNPVYSQLFFSMHAAGMESARLLGGGQASVAQLNEGARLEAQQWANENMTPKSWKEGVAPAIINEGKNRLETFNQAIESEKIGKGGKTYNIGDTVFGADGNQYQVTGGTPTEPQFEILQQQ